MLRESGDNQSAKNKLGAAFLQRVSGEGPIGDREGNQEQKRPTPQAKKSAHPIIYDIIMLLEVDRLIFKSFNTLIAMTMKLEAKRIADFLQE